LADFLSSRLVRRQTANEQGILKDGLHEQAKRGKEMSIIVGEPALEARPRYENVSMVSSVAYRGEN